MSGKRVVVISRQLTGFSAVPTKVVEIPSGDISLPGFCSHQVETTKRRFSNQFAEFSNAEWTYVVLDLETED